MKIIISTLILFLIFLDTLKAQDKSQEELDMQVEYLKKLTSKDSCHTLLRMGTIHNHEAALQETIDSGIIVLKNEQNKIKLDENNIAQFEWWDKNLQHVNTYYITISSLFYKTIDIIETKEPTVTIDFSKYKVESGNHVLLEIISSYCRKSELFAVTINE